MSSATGLKEKILMLVTIAFSKGRIGRHEVLGASDLSLQWDGREQPQRSLRSEILQLQHRQEILDKLPLC